jgi:Flp pilus assembly protein TadG
MKRNFRLFLDDEDGQATTELALVIPLLLVLLFAIFDFGRAVFFWNDENHVANLGARYAAVNTVPPTSNWPSSCGAAPPAAGTLAAYVWCQAYSDTGGHSTESNGTNGPAFTNDGVAKGLCVKVAAGSGTSVGNPVTVTVKGTYNYMPFSFAQSSFPTSSITGTATMMLEQSLPSTNSIVSTYDPAGNGLC